MSYPRSESCRSRTPLPWYTSTCGVITRDNTHYPGVLTVSVNMMIHWWMWLENVAYRAHDELHLFRSVHKQGFRIMDMSSYDQDMPKITWATKNLQRLVQAWESTSIMIGLYKNCRDDEFSGRHITQSDSLFNNSKKILESHFIEINRLKDFPILFKPRNF